MTSWIKLAEAAIAKHHWGTSVPDPIPKLEANEMSMYDRARQAWVKVQQEQISKGMKKYGVSLGDADISFGDLVKHATQENVDQMHYIAALHDKHVQDVHELQVKQVEIGMQNTKLKSINADQGQLIEELKKKLGVVRHEVPAPFGPGDKVRKTNGITFSDGKMTATVDFWSGRGVRLQGMSAVYNPARLELVPQFEKGDLVQRKDRNPVYLRSDGSGNFVQMLSAHVYYVDGNKVWVDEGRSWVSATELEKKPVGKPNPAVRPSKSIDQLCGEAFRTAQDKGWYDDTASFGEFIALVTSELSEALEDYRAGKSFVDVWYEADGKPCGILSELADAAIRIFDRCGYQGADLQGMIEKKMAYNATRPNRHGGKTL